MGTLGAGLAALLLLALPARAVSNGSHGEAARSHAARTLWVQGHHSSPTGVHSAFTGAAPMLAVLTRGAGIALGLLRFPVTRRVPDDRVIVLREQGRQVLNFPIHEPALGLYVNVSGEVEFERADIGFSDGTVESVDSFGVDRDNGLYELTSYDRARPVEWVRLVLRARSKQARVGISIGS